jgi:acyl carrier protein
LATQEVTDRVQRLFVEALNIQVPSAETDVIDGGLLDSLKLVELLFALEREFDISIAMENLDIDTFRSVSRIADFVEETQGGGRA